MFPFLLLFALLVYLASLVFLTFPFYRLLTYDLPQGVLHKKSQVYRYAISSIVLNFVKEVFFKIPSFDQVYAHLLKLYGFKKVKTLFIMV